MKLTTLTLFFFLVVYLGRNDVFYNYFQIALGHLGLG